MSTVHLTNRASLIRLVAAVFATVALFVTSASPGDCCSSHKGGGGHDHTAQATASGHTGHQHVQARPTSLVTQPPHGGQVHATGFQYFEVVYLPKETRVYVYGADQRPVSPRAVQGQIAMRVRGHEKLFRYPLKYFTVAGGSGGQEYLAAAVDVSRIRDGDMTVTFDLANLPYRQQPHASFTQTFALTRARPSVTVVALTESDRPGIAEQRACPVMGAELGSMGPPVKLLIGDQAVYLCCKGCIDKVRKNPEKYVAQAPAAGQLNVSMATAADQAAVQSQGVCPVMNSRLGAHGAPVKVTRGGQSLFLCCQGCLSKVEANPDYYFARAAQLRSGG